MYARYIPPSKPKAGDIPAEKCRAATIDSGPVHVTTGSFSYARYVPASTAPTPQNDNSDLNASLSFKFEDKESPESNEKKEEKKDKKKQKKKRNRDNVDGEPDKKKLKRRKEADDEEHSATAIDSQGKIKASKNEKGTKDKKKKRKEDKLDDSAKEGLDGEVPNGISGPEVSTSQGRQDEEILRETLQKSETRDREKKKKKDTERNKTVADSEDITHTNQKIVDGPEEVDERRKKDKREKKRKQKHLDASHDALEIGDAPSRHRAILEKKDKSLSRPLVQLEEPKEDSDDGEKADETGGDLETHGLEPLPQPEPVKFDTTQPGFEAMPAWIADPIRVTDDSRASFTDLGISEKAAKALAAKGFQEAFAVQAAAIPLLLPTARRVQGDVLISAATGSGKTLACAIPIVWDVCQGLVTRLRAVVVLPTRELARQAKEVFETCASAVDAPGRKKVKIGIAYGSQSLKHEQATLISREERYNPDAIKVLDSASKDDESESEMDIRNPVRGKLPNHVIEFQSAVDILICTPGRLVDHIKQTQGFSMKYVRWLVIDEGDKLLEQTYQGWTDIVRERLRLDDGSDEKDPGRTVGARDFPNSNYSGVRKIILSATLTKQGSLAAIRELDLRKPTLVVLGGDGEGAEHVLPATLREGALRFRDENLKPLYLHELLMSGHLRKTAGGEHTAEEAGSRSPTPEPPDLEDDSSKTQADMAPINYTALIFTKSNESALRLSRLLALLNPSLAPLIGTLTSATRPHVRRKTIASFTNRDVRLLVASDLVARGIDLSHLGHVVNYDLPASTEAYVHRVGRTARAGLDGWAWTLLPDGKESGWFWGQVVKGKKIVRTHKVERVSVGDMSEEKVDMYERALEELRKEAGGN